MKKKRFILGGYTLENICKDIRGTFYLHTVVFIIVVIGMAVPLWVGQMVWETQRNAALSKYKDAERLVVAEYKDVLETTQAEELEQKYADQCIIMPEKVGIGAFGGVIALFGDKSYRTNVQGCTQNFWQLNGYKIDEGIGPEQSWSGSRIPCYLKQGKITYDMGAHIGDVITVGDTEFEVAGIINAPKLYGSIAVPYDALSLILDKKMVQYQTLFLFPEQAKMAVVKKVLKEKYVFNLSGGEKQEQVYVDSVYAFSKEWMLSGIMMMIFTLVSLTAIISGMMVQEQRRMAIRAAIGAGYGRLFKEQVLRMEIMMAAACIIDVFLYPFLFGKIAMSRKLDIGVIVGIWLLFAVLLLCLSAALWRRMIGKRQIAKILKEGT